MAGNNDTTITAKFVADTSGFNTEKVVEGAKAAEASTTEMTKGLSEVEAASKQASEGIQSIGEASGQAAGNMEAIGTAGTGIERIGDDSKAAARELEDIGSASKQVEKELGSIGQAGKEASEGIATVGEAGKSATEGVADVGTSAEETKSKVKELGSEGESSFQDMAKGAEEAIRPWMMLVQVAQMIGQALAAIGQKSADIQNATSALNSMTKDAGVTQALMDRLAETSAQKDFGAKAIDAAAAQLMEMGKSATQTIPEIQALSDGIAKNGGNAAMLSPVIDQIEKIGKEGRVTSSDIDALNKAGINASQALADGMGTSVPDALKRVAQGAVSGKEAYDDMFKGLQQDVGATEDQSQQLGSNWSRLMDAMTQDMTPLTDAISHFIGLMADAIQQYGLFGGLTASFTPDPSTGVAPSATSTVATPAGWNLPGHATGGTNLSGLSIIGENGPELFDPNGGSIYPLDGSSSLSSLPAMGGQSGPVTIQIMLDSMMLAQQILPQLAPMIRVQTGRRV